MKNGTKIMLSAPLSMAIIFLMLILMGTKLYMAGPAEFKTEQMIEAESGTINGPMQKYTAADAGGGYYIMNHYTTTRKLDDPALQDVPDVSYTIDIPADGDYFLWLRLKVPMAGNEVFGQYLSMYIGSDNLNYNACIVMVNTGWEWQRVTNLRLKQGKHTLDFKHKDFGFGIDKLFLTATGSSLSRLGMDPAREDILRANYNAMKLITYPPLTEADGLGMDFPKPPPEHPRLYLRARDIPGLKEKANDPLMKTAWDKIVASGKEQTSGMLDAPVDGKANFTMSIINAIESKALMYVLYKDKALGRNAIEAMLNFFNTVKFNPSTSDIYRIYGRFIMTDAIVYDWCYDLLSKEEKTALIGWSETMASMMEIGWPRTRQGTVTGHASEFQLMRDFMSIGIATYDEDKDMYMLAAGRFFKYYIPARKFFYPAGYHHQGASYGITRFTCEMWPTYIWDRMGYPDIFGKDQGKVPYYFIYLRRPDGQYFRDGDDFKEKVEFGQYWTNGSDALAGYYFKDPIIIGEAEKQSAIGRGSDYLFDFLFYDTKVPGNKDKSGLPLTRYFKEPFGAMFARTGWDEGIISDAVVAEMKLGVFNFGNHQHLDAGNFQLYYKAPLAVESGIYEGTIGGYGSSHDYNYNKRTIAHNSMLIYDPNEVIRRNTVNDGGQRFPNGGSEPSTLDILLSQGYKTGDVIAHEFGPDSLKPEYTYLKGDLTMAYTNKVKKFQRSFVFLNLNNKKYPAALIVFDHVEASNKDFKKYWLLHCVEEPVISGNITTVKRGEKGYNGKMVNTTLLPISDNLIINKVGGKGNEFNVSGKNFPQYYNSDRSSYDGAIWRIEVSPKNAGTSDNFLNVMQVMDNAGGPEPLKTYKVDSDQIVGTMIADRIVLFSKTGDKLGDKVSFTLTGDGSLKVLVADMKQGFWKVEKSGETAKIRYEVTSDGGLLYFDGTGGKYNLSRSDTGTK